jgi:hypothetical protein
MIPHRQGRRRADADTAVQAATPRQDAADPVPFFPPTPFLATLLPPYSAARLFSRESGIRLTSVSTVQAA